MEKARLIISRHRIGTDGEGIRTLVSFSGCSLNCKYCINEELKNADADIDWFTPEQLLEDLNKDNYYFLATGGGVTFSGGEPLLHSGFIREFCQLCNPKWKIDIETCLNVPQERLAEVSPFISMFIVDVKDMSDDIYRSYTGRDNGNVISNLDYLKDSLILSGGKTRVVIRVPSIPGYNNDSDVSRSIEMIRERYDKLFDIDKFEYFTSKDNMPVANGKEICKVLKAVRRELIKENELGIVQPRCRNKCNCSGTCPVCEAELASINERLGEDGEYESTSYEIAIKQRGIHFHPVQELTPVSLLGVVTLKEPMPLLGDIKIKKPEKVDKNQE